MIKTSRDNFRDNFCDNFRDNFFLRNRAPGAESARRVSRFKTTKRQRSERERSRVGRKQPTCVCHTFPPSSLPWPRAKKVQTDGGRWPIQVSIYPPAHQLIARWRER